MRDLLAVLGLVFVVGLALVYVAFRLRGMRKEIEERLERRAVAKKSPFTTWDINFMVDAGLTPEQIEKAIKNAVIDLEGRSR